MQDRLIVTGLYGDEDMSLICRLGPPDFYPPTPNCAEEILNRDTTINGYKELIDGVEVS